MANKMRPIHPGEILSEELTAIAISANGLAKALGVPANRITEILNERRSVSADTALRLSHYFGTSAEFWMNLQTAYDLRKAALESGDRIARSVRPRAA
jgi:antitoxin HigA-1